MGNDAFSLDKLNYESIRRQKRRKLIRVSIIPLTIGCLAALWLLLPTILTHYAIKDYKRSNYASARRWLTPLTWTSPEPFVTAFNSGTVDTRLGKFTRAESELTRALALAPPPKRCMTAQNLYVSIRSHAESISNRAETKIYTTKAEAVIKANPGCFKGSGGGGGSGQDDLATDSQTPTEVQQQQLKQKEQEGRERQEQFARDETIDLKNPKIKPW